MLKKITFLKRDEKAITFLKRDEKAMSHKLLFL